MTPAKRFIYYSTIFMLFGSAIRYNNNNALQLFYLVMFINFILMLLMRRWWIPTKLLGVAAFLLISGALGVLRQTDTVSAVAKETVGIVVSAAYFCCFFRAFDFQLEEAFKAYARMAYWIALLGIVFFPIQVLFLNVDRLTSILSEPSMVAFSCIPALYYFADRWLRARMYGKEALVLLLAFILAQSSTGFIGIMFGIAVFGARYRRLAVIIPVIIVGLGYILYSTSENVALRVDDTYNAFTTANVDDANLSTYVLYSNRFIMLQVLKEHPFMGNGLGSHSQSFQKYIGSLPENSWTGKDFESGNADDACSLGIRTLSDMGIVGALLYIWFIWRFRPTGDTEADIMSKAMWLYFFIKIVRGGTYFSNEQYFFICFYALRETAARWHRWAGDKQWTGISSRYFHYPAISSQSVKWS